MPTSRERVLLGQFYTPRPVADLLAALTVDRDHATILDPGCGAGELLLAAHDHAPRATLTGIDIDPEAAALAATRLPRAHITTGDFFATPPVPTWDCILPNPP